MARLGSTPILAGLLAICLVGCTGQTLEGRWKGSLPYDDAQDCRIELRTEDRFTLSCSGHAWVGAGDYRQDGRQLTLTFSLLTRSGTAVVKPDPLVLGYVGHGNQMDIIWPGGKTTWERTMNDQ